MGRLHYPVAAGRELTAERPDWPTSLIVLQTRGIRIISLRPPAEPTVLTLCGLRWPSRQSSVRLDHVICNCLRLRKRRRGEFVRRRPI